MSRTPPKVDNAPGIIWRPAGQGWEARWQARTGLIERGFRPKSQRLWTGLEPSETEAAHISDTCRRLQDEMLVFGRGGLPVVSNPYDGTLRSLINCYQTDPDSTYHKLRYKVRKNSDNLLKRIAARHGHEEMRDIKARAINAWYEEWSDGGQKLATWQAVKGKLRVMFSFGFTLLECPECERLCKIMSELSFESPPSRIAAVTADQAILIRATAHHDFGWHSIAFGQALQFELILRQKDVIGEYVPMAEPGTSDVICHGRKWLRGLRWSEVDQNFILKHVTSKRQKELEIDLRQAPMVMEEMAFIAQVPVERLTRDMLPTTGPMVVNNLNCVPFLDTEYRRKWRKIANKAGIPKNVFNMDSRAGGITEASDADAPMEHLRHAATHSNISMTEKYSRNSVLKIANVQRIRVEARNKPKTD